MTPSKTTDYIYNAYWKEGKSIPEIAAELKTYPNDISRFCKKHGIKIKSRSESLKGAYNKGLRQAPMKGKKHSLESKIAISQKNSEAWSNLTEEERKNRSEIAKTNWRNRTPEKQHAFEKRCNKGLKTASKKGSKLERYLLKILIENGYKPDFHKERNLINTKLQIDFVLPEQMIAIEVDGPSHFEPIWGQKSFERTVKADKEKNSLLLANGFTVIRVKQTKNSSQKVMRDTAQNLLDKLNQLKDINLEREERYIEI